MATLQILIFTLYDFIEINKVVKIIRNKKIILNLVFLVSMMGVLFMFGCATLRYEPSDLLTPDGRGVLPDDYGFYWLNTARNGHRVFVNDYFSCKDSLQDKSNYIQCMKGKGYQPVACSDVLKLAHQKIGEVDLPPDVYLGLLEKMCRDAK